MKTLILILVLFLTLESFQNKSLRKNLSEYKSENVDTIVKNDFANCFANVDTTNQGQTIGCEGGIYKLLNKKNILLINFDFPIQFDSCYSVIVDGSKGKQLASLLAFDNNNANLANICSDVEIVNNPEPTRFLYAQSGNFILAFSNPTKLHGNPTYRVTILIKKLVFFDYKTGEKIIIENELLWKVLNAGIGG